jgi:hypothetical protein
MDAVALTIFLGLSSTDHCLLSAVVWVLYGCRVLVLVLVRVVVLVRARVLMMLMMLMMLRLISGRGC